MRKIWHRTTIRFAKEVRLKVFIININQLEWIEDVDAAGFKNMAVKHISESALKNI